MTRSSRLHLVLMVFWILLAIPTLTIWREAVWWIGLISIYANVSTHWGAYEAARAKEEAK